MTKTSEHSKKSIHPTSLENLQKANQLKRISYEMARRQASNELGEPLEDVIGRAEIAEIIGVVPQYAIKKATLMGLKVCRVRSYAFAIRREIEGLRADMDAVRADLKAEGAIEANV